LRSIRSSRIVATIISPINRLGNALSSMAMNPASLSPAAADRLLALNANALEFGFVRAGERVMTDRHGRRIIIVTFVTFFSVMVYFAAQLEPSSGVDSFWPSGHILKTFEEVSLKDASLIREEGYQIDT